MLSLLSLVIAISLSVALVVWLNRCKKRSTGPFENHMLARLLVFGAVSGIVASIIPLALGVGRLVVALGPETMSQLMSETDPARQQAIVSSVLNDSSEWTFLGQFVNTFLMKIGRAHV